MTAYVPLPFIGGAYKDDATSQSAQVCQNFIFEPAERPGTRTPGLLRQAPGASLISVLGDSPIRGTHDCEGLFVAVHGTTLHTIGPDGTPTARGTIPGAGRVSIAHNQITGGSQVVIANGQSGYVYDTKTQALSQITDAGFPGAKVVDFVDGYIAFVEPSGRYWGVSGLADGTAYNTLDRSEAEAQPDKINTLIAAFGEVHVFGERTSEVYPNAAAATGNPFQRLDGATAPIGCPSRFGVALIDGAVVFIGHDGCFYERRGYQNMRISTYAVEQAWSRCNLSQAFVQTFEDRGHKIVYVTFYDGQTWGYDFATREWHTRTSYGLNFWRMAHLTRWNRRWIAGDYAAGKLYVLDWLRGNEAGAVIERRRVGPVLHADGNRLSVNAFRVEVASGRSPGAYNGEWGATPGTFSASGNVPNGFVGDVVSGSYTTAGGYPGATFAVTAGTFPPGLTLNANGTYAGTFSTGGSYSWTVTATDQQGQTATVNDTATVSLEVLPPQLSGWRYLQVDAADATDYSDPDFDDSAWATGTAPFGSWEAGYGAPDIAIGAPSGLTQATSYDARFATPFATAWTNNTRLWLRRTLNLTSVPAGGVSCRSYMDDNYVLYVNGNAVVTSASGLPGGGGAAFSIDADDLVVGANVIAIRCDDEAPNGSASVVYADFIFEGIA